MGLELAYNNEFGSYQKKLSELLKTKENGLVIVYQKSMFTYQLYSYYAFKFSNNEALTMGLYFGGLIDLEETDMFDGDTSYNGYTIGLRFKKYAVCLLYESGQYDIRSTKFGLTYQL